MGFAKRVSNRLIFMDEGKILEDCPTHEFFDNLEARHERAKIFLEKFRQCTNLTIKRAMSGFFTTKF